MYWNNPILEFTWPSDQNPIQGQHLFYNPSCRFDNVVTNQRLQDLCNWANNCLLHDGIDLFVTDQRNHYDIANLVKLNMWIADIRKQGIVKPWLMLDEGNGTYTAGTGDSRLRCLECIPEIQTVPAFVSTCESRSHLYSDLEPVTTFDQFATLCCADPGQLFLFKFADNQATHGMYWYEYNSAKTRSVTPGESWCVDVFARYADTQSNLIIDKTWFDQLVPWHNYAE